MQNKQCDKCGRKFEYNSQFKKHMKNKYDCNKNKYPIMDIYKCDKCTYTTEHRSNFMRHITSTTSCNKINKKNINNNEDTMEDLLKKFKEVNEKMVKMENKLNKQQPKHITNNYIITNYNDALNIEDCLNSGNITQEMINTCKKLPLKDGAVYILDDLCNIEPTKRPIHCTDVNRQNYLVRSENSWTIDNKGEKIKNNFSPVILDVYKKVYKDLMENDTTQDEKIHIMSKMCEDLLDITIDKNASKAIKNTSNKYAIKNIIENYTNIDNVLFDQ